MTVYETKILAVAKEFITAWRGDWDEKATLRLRAPGCKQTMLPRSLGMATFDTEQFAERAKWVAPLVKDCKIRIDDMLAVPAQRKVVARSSMTAETGMGKIQNEIAWWLTLDEAGEKVTDIVEFMDSDLARDMQGKLAKAGKCE